MSFVLFAHVLGTALWIGGGLSGLMFDTAARGEPPAIQMRLLRVLARLHAVVIGLGALVVLGSGVLLTMALDTDGLGDLMREPKLWVMILAGIFAAFMVLFVSLPLASRMGALAAAGSKGDIPPALEAYRRRLALVSTISGGLAVVALLAWYVF
jgi:uncharacterized membrane protein